jgi:hypothetical protein
LVEARSAAEDHFFVALCSDPVTNDAQCRTGGCKAEHPVGIPPASVIRKRGCETRVGCKGGKMAVICA